MTKYLGRTLLSVPVTLFGVVTVVFLITRLIPGDPAVAILGDYASKERLQELREQLGLTRPLPVQYLSYLGDVLRGDLGRSLRTGQPVAREIGEVLPHTLLLAAASLVVSVLIGVPLGILAAVRWRSALDYVSMVLALLGISAPVFWIGILLIRTFSLRFHLLPAIGAGEIGDPASLLVHLVLPSIALGAFTAALTARITRASVLEVIRQEYVTTARAKGLAFPRVITRHVLQNALIPVVTVVGLNAGHLMAGAVVTETVFSRPGLGRLLIDAIYSRDYPQLQAAFLVLTLVFVLANVLVDIAYGLIDPRVRYA